MTAPTREAQNKIVQNLMREGLQVVDSARVDVRGSLKFGKNVQVDINVIFQGEVVLGDNVIIGPHCIIDNATVGSDVEIKENTSISSATLGDECRIGPYARVRPESDIGRGSHIGNFVEIKSTVMGPGCKINHHSFVGDSVLGKEVIIGAGSSTCNFDGSQVQKTHIEDQAFIGSGVQLIAPCVIGKGAFVAAGSTITQDVPAGMLALCRTQDMVLKDLPAKKS